MGIFFDAPVVPADQTQFVRRVPVPANLTLSSMFPTRVVASNKVAFSEITKTNRTARFRAFDGRIHVADRDGATDKQINMIPLSDSRSIGEYERLQLEMARLGGTNREALASAIYDDATDLTNYVQNRMEMAIGDVLVDGKLTPAELPGVEVDFGVPAGHLITVATSWLAPATANVVTDLVAACDAYEAANGFRPGSVLTSRRVARLLGANTALINAVKGAQTGVTRVSLSDAAGVLENEGIPSDFTIYETQLDVDGVTTRVIADDKLILLPPNLDDLLEIRYGITATALELVNSQRVDMAFQEAAGIVGVVIKDGPPFREFTFVDAIGMPILKDARKLMVLDVIP